VAYLVLIRGLWVKSHGAHALFTVAGVVLATDFILELLHKLLDRVFRNER